MSKRKRDSDTIGKSQIYKTSFQASYCLEFPCLIRGSDSYTAFYTPCNSGFSVARDGRDDCRRHLQFQKHLTCAQAKRNIQDMSDFFKPVDSSLEEAVTKAEALFTGFLIDHNIPLSAADHAGALFKAMFLHPSHSAEDIIKKYQCRRTKNTCIVKELAAASKETLVQTMKSGPFSIATDGSNDTGDKLYPLIIRYSENGNTRTKPLTLLECTEKGTGENIASIIDKQFEEKCFPWSNCIVFTTDNGNVMIGMKSAAYGFLLHKRLQLNAAGCICHRLHLACELGSKELTVDAESFLMTFIITWKRAPIGCMHSYIAKKKQALIALRCTNMAIPGVCPLEKPQNGYSSSGSHLQPSIRQSVKRRSVSVKKSKQWKVWKPATLGSRESWRI